MKRGFTLIELLAVIVILAIILLIAMPIILNVISEAKKGAFESTARGLMKTVENEYMKNALGGDTSAKSYLFENYVQTEGSLEFSGKGPRNGTINVNEQGQVAIAIEDGTWCIKKGYDDKDITVTELDESGCLLEEEEELGLSHEQLMCLIHNECDDVVLPNEYEGTEGEWMPIASRDDLENIDAATPTNFAPGTDYEKPTSGPVYSDPGGGFEQIYIFVDDIDMGETPFVPIGKNDRPFGGYIDGNHNTISGLVIDELGQAGFIYHVEQTGGKNLEMIIRNIRFASVYVEGGNYTGGIVGMASELLMENVYITGTVKGGDYTGGLLGHSAGDVQIIECETNLIVEGGMYVGGLVGHIGNSWIYLSKSAGTVTGTNNSVGGLVGSISANMAVEESSSSANVSGVDHIGGLIGIVLEDSYVGKSFATGLVSGNNYIGGFVGGVYAASYLDEIHATGNVEGENRVGGLVGAQSNEATINYGYATGSVDGNDNVGGLVGEVNGGDVLYSFATGNVIGSEAVGGLIGGVYGSSSMSIVHTYARGNVSGELYTGGLLGAAYGIYVVEGYATGSVSGIEAVGGIAGAWGVEGFYTVYALNTQIERLSGANHDYGRFYGVRHGGDIAETFRANEDMTFVGILRANSLGEHGADVAAKPNQAHFEGNNWNFDVTWSMGSDGYPKLKWQD